MHKYDVLLVTNNNTRRSSGDTMNIPSWACFIRYCCHF